MIKFFYLDFVLYLLHKVNQGFQRHINSVDLAIGYALTELLDQLQQWRFVVCVQDFQDPRNNARLQISRCIIISLRLNQPLAYLREELLLSQEEPLKPVNRVDQVQETDASSKGTRNVA